MFEFDQRIVISPQYRLLVWIHPRPIVILIDDLRRFVIRDKTTAHIFRLLKKGFTFPALVAALPSALRNPENVASIVSRFLSAGVLEFQSGSSEQSITHSSLSGLVSRAFSVMIRRMGRPSGPTRSALSSFCVFISSAVAANIEDLSQTLSVYGINVLECEDSLPDLYIAIGDNYLSPRLAAIIQQAQARNIPCLLFSPLHQQILIGPILQKDRNCWTCIRRRLAFQDPFYEYLRPKMDDGDTLSPPAGYSRPSLQYGFTRLALDVVQFALDSNKSTLYDRIVALDVCNTDLTEHWLPTPGAGQQCNCDDVKFDALTVNEGVQALAVDSWNDVTTLDFTAQLEQSRLQLNILTSRLTGIISEIEELPAPFSQDAFYIYTASYRLLHAYYSLSDVLHYGMRQSSALGRSRLEAEVKAGVEAIEHYSFAFQGHESYVLKAYADWDEPAVLPNALLNFSEMQYGKRESQNPMLSHSAAFIPEAYDPEMPIHWCKTWNVVKQENWWVPMACCFYGFWEDGVTIALADSNGTAAGRDLKFCFQNGLYELVQRDAIAITHYNMLSRQAVDVSSWDDPYLNRLIDIHRSLGRDVVVLNISTDIPLHVLAALSISSNGETVVQGFGAHHDATQALKQALQEVSQMLPNVTTLSKVSTRSHLPEGFRSFGASDDSVCSILPVQRHHVPNTTNLLARADFYGDRCVDGLPGVLAYLSAQNIEVLVKDGSRPETGFAAIRVMAPGLRSLFPRFGKGRLYDVPALLAGSHLAREEEELNPIHLFF